MSDETILQEAQRLVHGDRGASYGHPADDYRCTGRVWGAVLEHWLHSQGYVLTRLGAEVPFPDVPPRIGALMMAGVKLSREAQRHKRDNLTDLAGYAECASMIAEREADDGDKLAA